MRRYIDSSVILDLLFTKGKTLTLGTLGQSEIFTSRLTQVEVFRNVTRVDPDLLPVAAEMLSRIEFIELTTAIINSASIYPQEITLKSADAIHMASAEQILDVDDLLVTYDKQMALNAERLGIRVLTSF